MRYMIPAGFFQDCIWNGMDVGTKVDVSGSRIVIEATDEQIEELRDRASYYCDKTGGPDWVPAGLKQSARATLKALPAFD